MLPSVTSTVALLSLLASIQARPTPSAEFDEVLNLSPRDVVPAWVDKRDVPDYTAPKGLKQSIAYFPAIESPEQGSVWRAGSELTVAWNNTKPNYAPNQIHNFAQLLLGYRNPDDPASGLNLDVDRPLANVSLYGSEDPIQVLIPADLPTRSTYLLVLGSTANMSPLFTIEGTEAGTESSSASSATAMSTRTLAAAHSPAPSASSASVDQAQQQESPSTERVASSSPSPASRVGGQARVAPSASDDPSSPSPSPTAAAASSAPSPDAAPVAQSSAPSSSSSATKVSSISPASGGALAASSTPTSGASPSALSSGTALVFVGLVTLACMI